MLMQMNATINAMTVRMLAMETVISVFVNIYIYISSIGPWGKLW